VAYVALVTWFVTILPGLYMLAVWLIENDVTDRTAAASRLPTPVIFTHLLLAVTGLVVWVAYLLLGHKILAWAAVSILGIIALLGATMFARWIPVYREPVVPGAAQVLPAGQTAPPEGSFPVVLVFGHGLLAVSTAVLVLLTALGVQLHV
jgi:hypothetical protein